MWSGEKMHKAPQNCRIFLGNISRKVWDCSFGMFFRSHFSGVKMQVWENSCVLGFLFSKYEYILLYKSQWIGS